MKNYTVYTCEAYPDSVSAEWVEIEDGRLCFYCADPDPDMSPDMMACYGCGKWFKFIRKDIIQSEKVKYGEVDI